MKKGQYVHHQIYGPGIVQKIANSRFVWVKFEKGLPSIMSAKKNTICVGICACT